MQKDVQNQQHICYQREGKLNISYTYCVSKAYLPDDLKINQDDILGVGMYGTVLSGTFGNKEVAIKFIAINTPIPTEDCGSMKDIRDCLKYTEEEFYDEVREAKFVADLGIGPNVLFYKIIYCDSYHHSKMPTGLQPLIQPKYVGIIVSEKFGMSLKHFIKKYPQQFKDYETDIFQSYKKSHKILNDTGFRHADNHFGNILIDPKTFDIYFIDTSISKIKDLKKHKRKLITDWDEDVEKLLK